MRTPPAAPTPDQILQRLDWQVIRRLDGLLQGNYRSLFYGAGIDFADLREYQPGDDVRAIDWNVTARMDGPYVRQYTEDREISAWFLLDLSPSMDFGTLQAQKRDVLIGLVSTLARLLTRQGNRVGALLFGGTSERSLAPRGGRLQVLSLIDALQSQTPRARAPLTNLADLLSDGLRRISRRALVFVVSDFISAPGWERPLTLLAQRHELLAMRVWDERERVIPDVGPIILEDAETGEQLYVDTHDRRFRERFAAAAQRREEDLAAALKRSGVASLSLSTEEDLVAALARFAALRRRSRTRG